MGAPKSYNGHHCWNCWNVSLWIYNDEPLYRFALDCIAVAKEKPGAWLPRATRRFLADVGMDRTPDGAKYTRKAVMSALEGLSE
jgi:hypothetical protein